MKKTMMDANLATAHIAYACSEVATIYPITPSSSMAEACDDWANQNKPNVFGSPLKVVQMQSEAGAAGAMHGSLAGGALSTTFTASQGLLLMIPNMYKMAGELLPAVFHISARSLTTHALSIFGDHSDVMAVRQTGFAMLASANPQEAMDMALISHLSALDSSVPFLHFFDGFTTSHQLANVETIDYDAIKSLIPFDKVQAFKARSLNPDNPHQQGTAQNPDIFFQNREASNPYYNKISTIVQQNFDKLYKATGRRYKSFDYYGKQDAKKVIVLMASGCDTAKETVDYLNQQHKNVGVVVVRLYRPFDTAAFTSALPKSVEFVGVLDKTKESGSVGEPLYLDIITALAEQGRGNIKVLGGRYGLGGKDLTPAMIKAVFDNLTSNGKNHFTVGITDDVTNTSLAVEDDFVIKNNNLISCKFYGIGGDGTVSASRSVATLIGEDTNLFAQAFFEYDSKKNSGLTISHLKFSTKPIVANYLIKQSQFVVCNWANYVNQYDMLSGITDGGTFLLNSTHQSLEELYAFLPNDFKRKLSQKNISFYHINAEKLAQELGLGDKVNTIMQSAFFFLSNVIDYEDAKAKLKELNAQSYEKYGELVQEINDKAVDLAANYVLKIEYPKDWSTLPQTPKTSAFEDKYYNNFIAPILNQKGDTLPVSSFSADGKVPTDTAKFEKRQVALQCPLWLERKCIQCNQCAFVCPHAAIKPVLIDDETAKTLPEEFVMLDAVGAEGKKYRMQINPLDCTGCGVCVNVCPTKALFMAPQQTVKQKEENNYYLSEKLDNLQDVYAEKTVKGSQFKKPLFEFSGACAGCGETPYIKLLTQLFGERMIIANATGCSSIYGGYAPACPYAKNKDGKGPAWANSLFEDNAEFGLGIHLAYQTRTQTLLDTASILINSTLKNDNLKAFLKIWTVNHKDATTCKNLQNKLAYELELSLKQETDEKLLKLLKTIKSGLSLIVPKSLWMIGGDGWAYDIGASGIDHILSSGQNVNILVLDNEVYSNTGGQSSKSSPTGSMSKFAGGGKNTRKKDLGLMAMHYKDVYLASVAMGANMNQLMKAFTEAESYDGPSLIIAYSTCITHGIDMANSQNHMKDAVDAGYWSLYRYDPRQKALSKNPFTLDSKKATSDKYKDFLKTEHRYNQLSKTDEAGAQILFEKAKQEATERIETYQKLAQTQDDK